METETASSEDQDRIDEGNVNEASTTSPCSEDSNLGESLHHLLPFLT